MSSRRARLTKVSRQQVATSDSLGLSRIPQPQLLYILFLQIRTPTSLDFTAIMNTSVNDHLIHTIKALQDLVNTLPTQLPLADPDNPLAEYFGPLLRNRVDHPWFPLQHAFMNVFDDNDETRADHLKLVTRGEYGMPLVVKAIIMFVEIPEFFERNYTVCLQPRVDFIINLIVEAYVKLFYSCKRIPNFQSNI